MLQFLEAFVAAFVPILVAVDPLGTLPLYLGLTEEFPPRERRAIARDSVLTAFALSVGFVLAGGGIFRFLGISREDFLIAGGSILFVFALLDLAGVGKAWRRPGPMVGVVPLGTPLIAGPAVLTTALLMAHEHGLGPTLVSLTANVALLWVALRFAGPISRVLGSAGLRAISKLVMLFLAALGVMLVRKGILAVVQGG